MKLTYFGTAAAEGLPAPFCDCPICTQARNEKGKNVRSRSQALVDDSLLLDFPADSYYHFLQNDVNMLQVTDLLITHSHSDHWYVRDLIIVFPPFGHHREDYTLTLHGNESVCDKLEEAASAGNTRVFETVKVDRVKAFQTFQAGEYQVTPLPADHCYSENALFYLIERDGKALLYAHDTGYFLDSVWEYLATRKDLHLGLVSLDCTHGFEDQMTNHMSFSSNALVRDRLIEMGLADSETIFVCNHFSHNCGGTYPQVSVRAQEQGMLASYDGMTVEF